jgi:Uma2 family endonuclease
MVVCGKSEYADDGRDTITNPRVVVEVLSPSTRDRDLGSKLRMYGSLPSFGELLAVYQDQPRVEIMRKHDDKHWTIDITSDLDELVSIATLGIQIPMSEFYEGVEFLQD